MNARTRRMLLAGGSVVIMALALLWGGYSRTQAQSPSGTGLNQRFVTTDNGTVAILIPFFGSQAGFSNFSNQAASSQVGGTSGSQAGAANNVGANNGANQTGSANQSANSAANNAANSAANNQFSAMRNMANRSLLSQGFSGNLIAQLEMNSSATVTFDTRVELGTACANIVAFRMTEIGDLIMHPVSCVGDMLTLRGTGGNFASTYFLALGRFANGLANQANQNTGVNGAANQANQNTSANAASGATGTASNQVGGTTGTQTGALNNQTGANQTTANQTIANQSTANQAGSLAAGQLAANQGSSNQVQSALFNPVNIISRNQINNAAVNQSSIQFQAMNSLRNQNFGGNLIGQVDINAADTITFDTQVQLGASCANVVVFRMTGNGDLIQHPVSCAANMLTLRGTGGNFMSTYFFALGQFR